MKPDGTVVGEYDIPTSGGGPRAIVAAPDGRLFFGQYDSGRIGEVRP
jgi:virginiamycin B lyase